MQQNLCAGRAEDEPTASAALFFGAACHWRQRHRERVRWSGRDEVPRPDRQVLAHENGGLGQRGVVPNRGASTLHITKHRKGIVRLPIRRIASAASAVSTPLKVAVDEAARLLDAFGEPDEEASPNRRRRDR
jgi:hypothetical protein